MQLQIDIGFEQLVQIVKKLPAGQWSKLKQEVEKDVPEDEERTAFRKLLLNGPVFSEEQLELIAETRKEINAWRAK